MHAPKIIDEVQDPKSVSIIDSISDRVICSQARAGAKLFINLFDLP